MILQWCNRQPWNLPIWLRSYSPMHLAWSLLWSDRVELLLEWDSSPAGKVNKITKGEMQRLRERTWESLGGNNPALRVLESLNRRIFTRNIYWYGERVFTSHYYIVLTIKKQKKIIFRVCKWIPSTAVGPTSIFISFNTCFQAIHWRNNKWIHGLPIGAGSGNLTRMIGFPLLTIVTNFTPFVKINHSATARQATFLYWNRTPNLETSSM